MDVVCIIALLLTGTGVGLASGMIGVGGCFIMVPVQYWVLTSMGIDEKVAILVAFGTNLFVVLPTAVSSAYRHHMKGAVLWRPAAVLGLSGGAMTIVGAYLATLLPSEYLTIGFGAAILAGALRMLTARPMKKEESPPEELMPYLLWGIPLGLLSGLVGIGGGVLIIPVMVLALHFSMHKAVGSSTAMMIFTALAGTAAYVFNGLGESGLPEYSVGYVNLLQWALLVATSVPMAQVGALFAHRVPAKKLRMLFIVVMVYMGLKMVGVFKFLGLPL